jgi:hypothetical protein
MLRSSLVRQSPATIKTSIRRVSLNGRASVADFIDQRTFYQDEDDPFSEDVSKTLTFRTQALLRRRADEVGT